MNIQKIYALFAILGTCLVLLSIGKATAQQNLAPPTAQALSAGVANGLPTVIPAEVGLPSADSLIEKRIFEILVNAPDIERNTRGPNDIALFRIISPSVVLISTPNGTGSGSVISDGLILTNWHVIDGVPFVGVLYKPDVTSAKAGLSIVTAQVIKVDQLRDLALLKPNSIPSSTKPIELGDIKELQVGADVHAVGHPNGQNWSYTTGIISQIRDNYTWFYDSKIEHHANVIQTQTPINPGNSGGPLLSDDGRLIGVNSFKSQGEGLNYAVSVTEVRRFLTAPKQQLSAPTRPTECSGKVLYEGRNKSNDANIRQLSSKCDNVVDIVYMVPDDRTAPLWMTIDQQRRNKTDVYDVVYVDPTRTGKWQVSYWDVGLDDTFPLKGVHQNGEINPSRFEKRCPGKALTDFRCG
jgi:S1-C subfamily serine protease